MKMRCWQRSSLTVCPAHPKIIIKQDWNELKCGCLWCSECHPAPALQTESLTQTLIYQKEQYVF